MGPLLLLLLPPLRLLLSHGGRTQTSQTWVCCCWCCHSCCQGCCHGCFHSLTSIGSAGSDSYRWWIFFMERYTTRVAKQLWLPTACSRCNWTRLSRFGVVVWGVSVLDK